MDRSLLRRIADISLLVFGIILFVTMFIVGTPENTCDHDTSFSPCPIQTEGAVAKLE